MSGKIETGALKDAHQTGKSAVWVEMADVTRTESLHPQGTLNSLSPDREWLIYINIYKYTCVCVCVINKNLTF